LENKEKKRGKVSETELRELLIPANTSFNKADKNALESNWPIYEGV